MFQIGDKVVYGIHGVCCITEQEERVLDKKRVMYLVLEPIGQEGSKYFVPTHNAAAMSKLKPMLSCEALEAILSSEVVKGDGWIEEENLRKQTYREMICSGDRAKLLCMVRTLYLQKEAQNAAGRKFHLCDDNFLRDAEKLLCGEISVILNMETDQARTFLRNRLKET